MFENFAVFSLIMEWMNYHHLYYFWTVAKEGGLAPASEKLRLAQSTLSGQIKTLENSFGQVLFEKRGRGMVLTETGRMVYRYAEEIFALGRELVDTLNDRPVGLPIRVTIGIADVVPKLVVRKLLEPVMGIRGGVRLICTENKPDVLLAELSLHQIDAVIMDAPVGPHSKVKAHSRILLESGVSFFGTGDLLKRYQDGFPASLDGAPVLLPFGNTSLRRSLEAGFKALGVTPVVKGEFEDAALLKSFGQMGIGLFPAPSVIAEDVERQFSVFLLGAMPYVTEKYFAVTVDRKILHPAVAALCLGR